jgi:hypothetical protein
LTGLGVRRTCHVRSWRETSGLVPRRVGGVHPDLNRKGIDDAIDIESGDSVDNDGNGVPDDARRARR